VSGELEENPLEIALAEPKISGTDALPSSKIEQIFEIVGGVAVHIIEAHRIVLKELLHIPRGSIAQNAFRAAYSAYRQHDLTMDANASPHVALFSAEALVGQSQPGFVPKVDEEFFPRSLTLCLAR
jgi:hypothetical protein